MSKSKKKQQQNKPLIALLNAWVQVWAEDNGGAIKKQLATIKVKKSTFKNFGKVFKLSEEGIIGVKNIKVSNDSDNVMPWNVTDTIKVTRHQKYEVNDSLGFSMPAGLHAKITDYLSSELKIEVYAQHALNRAVDIETIEDVRLEFAPSLASCHSGELEIIAKAPVLAVPFDMEVSVSGSLTISFKNEISVLNTVGKEIHQKSKTFSMAEICQDIKDKAAIRRSKGGRLNGCALNLLCKNSQEARIKSSYPRVDLRLSDSTIQARYFNESKEIQQDWYSFKESKNKCEYDLLKNIMQEREGVLNAYDCDKLTRFMRNKIISDITKNTEHTYLDDRLPSYKIDGEGGITLVMDGEFKLNSSDTIFKRNVFTGKILPLEFAPNIDYQADVENLFIERAVYMELNKEVSVTKNSQEQTRVIVLYGAALTGKSYLTKMLYFDSSFKYKIWIKDTSIEENYRELSGKYQCEIDECAKGAAKFNALKNKLNRVGHGLLVIDGVNDFEKIRGYLPEHGWYVLLTTNKAIDKSLNIHVDEMLTEKAEDLVKKLYKPKNSADLNPENLQTLFELVGTFPGVLEQEIKKANAFDSFTIYCDNLRRNPNELMVPYIEKIFAQTLVPDKTADFLQICSYLPSKNIELNFIKECLSLSGDTFYEIVYFLVKHSIIRKVDNAKIQISPIFQQGIRVITEQRRNESFCFTLMEVINLLVNGVSHKYYNWNKESLAMKKPLRSYGGLALLETYSKELIKHLKDLDNPDENDIQIAKHIVSLSEFLTKIYYVQGNSSAIIGSLTEILKKEIKIIGGHSVEVATTRGTLGLWERKNKNYQVATDILKEALRDLGNLSEKNKLVAGIIYGTLGKALSDQKIFDGAIKELLKAIQVKEELEKKECDSNERKLELAVSYVTIGLVYMRAYDDDKCTRIEISSRDFSQQEILEEKNFLSKAKGYFLKALELQKACYGYNHYELANTYLQLSRLYQRMLDNKTATVYAQQAYDLKKKQYEDPAQQDQLAEFYGQLIKVGGELAQEELKKWQQISHSKDFDLEKACDELDYEIEHHPYTILRNGNFYAKFDVNITNYQELQSISIYDIAALSPLASRSKFRTSASTNPPLMTFKLDAIENRVYADMSFLKDMNDAQRQSVLVLIKDILEMLGGRAILIIPSECLSLFSQIDGILPVEDLSANDYYGHLIYIEFGKVKAASEKELKNNNKLNDGYKFQEVSKSKIANKGVTEKLADLYKTDADYAQDGEAPYYTSDGIQMRLSNECAHIFIITNNTEPVGSVRIFIDPKSKLVYISDLIVSAKERGKGVASFLMRKVFAKIADQSIEHVFLTGRTKKNRDYYTEKWFGKKICSKDFKTAINNSVRFMFKSSAPKKRLSVIRDRLDVKYNNKALQLSKKQSAGHIEKKLLEIEISEPPIYQRSEVAFFADKKIAAENDSDSDGSVYKSPRDRISPFSEEPFFTPEASPKGVNHTVFNGKSDESIDLNNKDSYKKLVVSENFADGL